MTASAMFSRCRIYRYTLQRAWAPSRGIVMFVGLNPSTADETSDDPTIRRCIRFAMDWGYGGIVVTNLFAYRSTDPRRLLAVTDPIGPDNDRWLAHFSERVGLTVVAWGARGGLHDRDAQVLRSTRKPHCLGFTEAGAPRHPLYIRADTCPVPFVPA